jgi:hypothetical protein
MKASPGRWNIGQCEVMNAVGWYGQGKELVAVLEMRCENIKKLKDKGELA